MKKSVEKVFIGKDISRTSSLVIGGAGDNLAAGEIVVLDKNKNILTAGATYSDTDIVYIVEGLSEDYSYVNEAGTSVTGVTKYMISDPIQGAAVVEYSGKAYAAAAEAVWSIDFTGFTPVSGTEYVIRIVYKDVCEHPGQFTKTYRYTAASAVLDTEMAAFVVVINADVNRRVNAAYNNGTDILTLTGIAYDDNTLVDSINEYAQVNFEVFLTSDNFTGYDSSALTTEPSAGSGTYKLVRDDEKWSQGYEGIMNRTQFPIIKPDFRTVLNETYDTVIIRHKNWYTSSSRSEEQVDITTKIFIPNTATSNQMTDVLAVLNPWMASTPRAFGAVTF